MTYTQLPDVAASIAMSTNGWNVIVAPNESLAAMAADLQDELLFQDETSEGSLSTIDHWDHPNTLVNEITHAPKSATVIIIADGSKLHDAAEILDASRSLFVDGPRIVLVTDSDGAKSLGTMAPNLWSFINYRYWENIIDIPAADISQRLTALQEATGQTNDEVIRAAEEGRLSPEPIYAEWLALLGRGDLIGR